MFASDDEDDTVAASHTKADRSSSAGRTNGGGGGSGRSRSSQNSRGKNVVFAGDVEGGNDGDVLDDSGAGAAAGGVDAADGASNDAVGTDGDFDLSAYATDEHKVCDVFLVEWKSQYVYISCKAI